MVLNWRGEGVDFPVIEAQAIASGGGCGIMSNKSELPFNSGASSIDEGRPLTAAFWKDGKVQKFACIDCVINANSNYTEVHLRGDDNSVSMFVLTKDPEIEAVMRTQSGDAATFDGFRLTAADGALIEQISVHDNRTIH